MGMFPVEDYVIKNTIIAGVSVVLATYRVGEVYHCVVSNEQPEASVTRSTGSTADAALISATILAKRRFLGS